MFAVFARYRGRSTHRAEHVRASAEALSRLEGLGEVRLAGIEEIESIPATAEAVLTLVMALLAAGDWAIGIGIAKDSDPKAGADDSAEKALSAAHSVLAKGGKAGHVKTRICSSDKKAHAMAEDISAAFALLHHVISRRSPEGREATHLMRAGWTQVEAAAELGVSKQAINQRLAAAGWNAELAGWNLAAHLLERGHTL